MIVDVAAEYPEQMKAFSKEVADQLPPHRKWDHEIPLIQGAKIPNGITYKISLEEVHRKLLDEMIASGKIRRSRSATAAPVLFVRKKNGSI